VSGCAWVGVGVQKSTGAREPQAGKRMIN